MKGSRKTLWLEQSEGNVQLPVGLTSMVVSDHPDVPVKSWQAGSPADTASFSPVVEESAKLRGIYQNVHRLGLVFFPI